MSFAIETITMPLIANLTVNCYLIRLADSFVLIDAGAAGRRAVIEQALNRSGCQPGDLKLIILTHGDFDHCGNAAYLRNKYGSTVVMHKRDSGMLEQGDMFWSRKKPNRLIRALYYDLLFKLKPENRCTPDGYVGEGDDLSAYGFDARVIHLPGHSQGSIGILTADGDLFCGDLLGNMREPKVWMLVDDETASKASVAKLKTLSIGTVYPGHGQPFAIEQFWNAN